MSKSYNCLTMKPVRLTQPFIVLGLIKEYEQYSWEDKGRYGSFRLRIERVGVQVKL